MKIPPKKILVVDDDRQIVDILQGFLQREGYEVTIAASVASALQIIRNSSRSRFPDLVLSDVKMGAATGMDLAKILGKEHPDLPVVLLSVFADVEKEALASGARLFLRKPFSLADLAKAIESELEMSSVDVTG